MSAKLPKSLKPNSTIGLICPAGGFVDYKPINYVIKYLNNFGYKVKVGKSVICSNKDYKYLSGSDSERLLDLYKFWNDETIDAIFCLRGGYGTLRLLKDIDFSYFKKRKKIILGYSDITVLLLIIHAKANLVTFHGPLLGINFIKRNLKPVDNQSEIKMWNLLKDPEFRFSYSCKNIGDVIFPGKAVGKLIGGNLTDICSMLGSPYLPLSSFKQSILFLEDVNEEPYAIDRRLTQLLNAGVFDDINGLVFCRFENCGFKNKKELLNLLRDKVSKYNIPVIFNFPIGHGIKNFTVPIGQKVLLDADNFALKSI